MLGRNQTNPFQPRKASPHPPRSPLVATRGTCGHTQILPRHPCLRCSLKFLSALCTPLGTRHPSQPDFSTFGHLLPTPLHSHPASSHSPLTPFHSNLLAFVHAVTPTWKPAPYHLPVQILPAFEAQLLEKSRLHCFKPPLATPLSVLH